MLFLTLTFQLATMYRSIFAVTHFQETVTSRLSLMIPYDTTYLRMYLRGVTGLSMHQTI
jgi:hypothetical protein